jgi:hypothetical protein
MTTPLPPLYQRYKNLIPMLVLTALCVGTIVTRFTGMRDADDSYPHIILTWKHDAAFAAVILNYIIFFGFRPYFKWSFIATLLLGLVCLINFTVADSQWSLKMGNTKIFIIQPASFYVALLTLLLNVKTIRAKQDKSESAPENRLSNEKYYREDLEKFKTKYAGYPDEDLQKIMADRHFTAATLEAAEHILSERKANP